MACVDRMDRQLTCQRYQLVVTSLLLAIFLVGMALRLYRLDAKTLWTDEMITAARSQLDLRSIVQLQVESAGHPPLLYLVTHFFFWCAGKHDFVVRMQAVLFGSLSVLLTFKVGEILWSREEGLVAALLLAVNAYHVQYSQEARHYALMIFLALLSLIFLVKALQKKQMRLWIAFAVCTSLSLYNHYFAFLLLPAEVIFGIWMITENWLSYTPSRAHGVQVDDSRGPPTAARQLLMLSVSLLLVGLSYLPWVPVLQAQFPKNVQSQVVGAATPAAFESSLSFLRSVLVAYSGGGAATFLWVALFVFALATCRWKRIALVAVWVGTPFVFLSAVQTTHFVHPRYVLLVLPLYLLAIAKGLTAVAGVARRWPCSAKVHGHGLAVVVSALTMLAVATFSLVPLRAHYGSTRPDWRSAAEYLKENFAPGQLILADGEGYGGVRDGMRVATRLPFYLARYSMEDVPVLPIGRGLSQAVLECPRAGNGEVWAVILHPSSGLDAAELQGEIAVVDFEQVSVIRLREPSENVLQDTVSMLHILRDVLPAPEAHFDVHLALAEISLRTGGFDQAALELDMADRVKPDRPKALRDLAEGRAELEQLSTGVAEAVRNPLWRSLGSKIAFLGYDLYPSFVRPGDSLHLSLYWQSLQTTDAAYTVFTHLLDTGDRIWAQQDNQPHHGERPTSTWLPGEVIGDEYDLPVRADTPAGEYVLEIGMYDGVSGQRVPVCGENGEKLEYSRILLQSVTVQEP